MIASGDTGRRTDRFDPARVPADPEGTAALEALVGRLRASGAELRRDSGDPLVAMAVGEEADERAVVDALGAQTVRGLAECGALDIAGRRARLTTRSS